jgi:hypothetical protein
VEYVILFALLLVPVLAPKNPAPGFKGTKTLARGLECEQVTTAEGVRTHPGEISPERPRGDYLRRGVLLCQERFLDPGVRDVRDEAILGRLEATASEMAVAALATGANPARETWHVEVFYPSAQVSTKLSFATKNALAARGARVSDRTPVLAAGDIEVVTRMRPDQAYPTACRRYFELGSLGEGDTLLAVVSLDERETIVHAGLCSAGGWRWLR